MDGASLPASVTAAAVMLARGKSAEEIDLLSALFVQLGDTLATISAQCACDEAAKSGTSRLEPAPPG